MSLTYVIPDIHGRCDLLNEGLAGISGHSGGDGATIVTIGDYVDKGPQSRQVIERLLSGVAEGWRLVALKGNHDAMMVDALRNPSKMASWLGKGGDAGLASYGGDPAAIPQSHLAWLDGLQLMHVDAHRVYVHAGVDPEVPLAQQSMIILPRARYCMRVVPTSTRSPGGPGAW
jgi:serine/threonine protein phosphatase 1